MVVSTLTISAKETISLLNFLLFTQAMEMSASAMEKDVISARLLRFVKDEIASTTAWEDYQNDSQSKQNKSDLKDSSTHPKSSKQHESDSKDSSPHPIKSSREPWLDPYVRGKVRNLQKPFNSLVIGSKARKHTPLLERPLCESLEDRVRHFVKRRRIEMVEKGEEEEGKEEEEGMVEKGEEEGEVVDKGKEEEEMEEM